MFPYWLLFSVFAAGAIQYRERGPLVGRRAPLLPVAMVFTALMIGLRYKVGGDWQTYEQFYASFRHLALGDALEKIDIGYAALNWVGAQLGVRVWFVNLVCAAIFSWGLLKFARRQRNPWLTIAAATPYLVIVVAMGYTRQAVAIGFILAGLAVFGRASILRFIFFIACAAAFHKSAVILLPIAGLAISRQRITSAALVALLGILLYYLFAAEAVDPLIKNYVGTKYSSQGAAIRIAMNIPPALLYLAYRNKFTISKDEKNLWTNFSLASFVALVFLMTSPSSAAVDRISLYIIPLQMFVLSQIPYTFTSEKRSGGQLTVAVILYSAFIEFVWLNFAAHSYLWVPYRLVPALPAH